MRRAEDALRAAGATVALALLLIGLPTLLVTAVGWPLPRAVPTPEQVGDTLAGRQPLETAAVWKILALMLWLAWIQVLAAAVVEAVSAARGSLPNGLPGLNLAHGLVAPLVAAIVLAWPVGGASGRAAALPTPAAAGAPAPPVNAAPPTTPAVAASPSVETTVEHVVQRRDTLWDLAERYLGDGFRAGEIFELNRGQPQPDGGSLNDPGVIRPGWILQIPADPQTSTAAAVVVEPGDTLWDIAEEHLGDGHRFSELVDLNVGDPQPGGGGLTDPAVIRPGWVIELPSLQPETAPSREPPAPTPPPASVPPAEPATAAPEPVSTAPAPTVPSPPARGAPTSAPAPPETDAVRRDRLPEDDVPAAMPVALGVAGGLLGAGIASAVAIRRRRRAAQRAPGLELPPLPAEAAEVLNDLAGESVGVAIAAARTIRGLSVELARRSPVPAPLVAAVHGGHVELLLDRRDRGDPPPGWSADADGWIWRAPIEQPGPEAGTGWLPALVSVGAVESGGLLLNLEALGAVGIVGDATEATELATSIVTELAMSILADAPLVHVVDGDPCAPFALPGIEAHPSIQEAITVARRNARDVRAAIQAGSAADVFELRCHALDEAWVPAIVVARYDPSRADEIAELVADALPGKGTASVIVGECPSGATEIRVEDGRVSIPALGLACPGQRLDPARVGQIAAVVAAADAPAQAAEPPPQPNEGGAVPASAHDAEARARVRVRLLGRIEADGANLKPQQVAVLTYLVLNPESTADALRDAVWGGRLPTRERFLNTMHDLRRQLGPDVLPVSTDGRYAVNDVACDGHEFLRLREDAAASTPEVALRHLREAVDLIGGPPLTYDSRHRRHYTWVDLGNHANRWERLACDAAHELATLALEFGQPSLAMWAAERGLAASPASEILIHDLVAAHLALGDRRAAQCVADAYARALEDLGLDEPHELYDLLEGRAAS